VAALDYITLAEWKTITGWRPATTSRRCGGSDAHHAGVERAERVARAADHAGETSATKRVAVRGCARRPRSLRRAQRLRSRPGPESSSPRTLTLEDDYTLQIGAVTRDGVYTHLRLFAVAPVPGDAALHAVRVRAARRHGRVGNRDGAGLAEAGVRDHRAVVASAAPPAPFYAQDARDLGTQPVAVGELPYAAQNLARPWKRHIGAY
jgi:hypothetical protein